MTVGLTGGIGSGKTTVAQLFETMGCAIYNTDRRAKELYYEDAIKLAVKNLLGEKAYINDFEIDKEYISQKVFSDAKLLQQLNAIIHPAVKKDFLRFQSTISSKKIIIKETALLFETGIYKDLDQTILVTSPQDIKIERVMKRNHISKEEVEKRIASQWSDEIKIPLANFVIINDHVKALMPQVIQIYEKLKQHL